MATWRVDSAASVLWTTGTVKNLNDRVVCRIAYGTQGARAFVYECTTAGTTHASTEPTWPLVVGNTVADGTAVWTCRSPSDGTWANASCILLYIVNHAYVSGDVIYVDDGHAESVTWTADVTYTFSNDKVIPVRIICVDKNSSDVLSVGAIVTNNANYKTIFAGSLYCYGVCFKHTASTSTIRFKEQIGGDSGWKCVFEGDGTANSVALWTTTTNGNIILIPATSNWTGELIILNSNIRFDSSVVNIQFWYNCPSFKWIGGTLVASGELTNLISVLTGVGGNALIKDVDLSQLCTGATTRSLVIGQDGNIYNVLFERCKLPSASGFRVVNPASKIGGKIQVHHCSSANNTYDFAEHDMSGATIDETTIVRTGGAQHDVTGISYKMVSNANVLDNYVYMESPLIQSWTDSTTSKTFTIECIVDSATNLQNDEVWMELEYPANNTDGLGGFARDKCAILGTPVDKSPSASGIAWTTTGMSNPNLFVCQVTVTPGKAGPITARICLAKASSTIYIDPIITES